MSLIGGFWDADELSRWRRAGRFQSIFRRFACYKNADSAVIADTVGSR